MKLPDLKKPQEYLGLYVVDFGEHTGVGFTAGEVAELLESEKYKNCKVYKIHRAYPDGRLELRGVPGRVFHLEAGMFFYSSELKAATDDFKRLIALAVKSAPPCRAKVHLAAYGEDKFAVALIYPAEYDDEISSWLLAGQYRTEGPAEGGIEAAGRYYEQAARILDRHQLFGREDSVSRTGRALLTSLKLAVQR